MRGYMTHKGLPDGPKSARVVLKDYVKVSIHYVNAIRGDFKTQPPVDWWFCLVLIGFYCLNNREISL